MISLIENQKKFLGEAGYGLSFLIWVFAMKCISKISLGVALILLGATIARADVDSESKLLELVSVLESRIVALETRVQQLESLSLGGEENSSWNKNVRKEIEKVTRTAEGLWTDPANWTKIEKRMKADDVLAILGKPSKRKFSVS